MLELPDATRKWSSNSAKRMRFRSLQLLEHCTPLGQALGWTATRPERRSFDRHWRRTPTKEANCLCRSTKLKSDYFSPVMTSSAHCSVSLSSSSICDSE